MTVKKEAPPQKDLYQRLNKALEKYKGQNGVLIQALHEAQQIFGYLPREVQIHVANELTIPLSEVYSVVSFYSLFTTKPRGKHRLEVCLGTACYIKGAGELLEKLEQELDIKPEQVTADKNFSLSIGRCLGACSAAPVLKIDRELHGDLTPDQIPILLEEYHEQ